MPQAAPGKGSDSPSASGLTSPRRAFDAASPGKEFTTPAWLTSLANRPWTDDQIAHRFTGATDLPVMRGYDAATPRWKAVPNRFEVV
jgi:hypothetical protein